MSYNISSEDSFWYEPPEIIYPAQAQSTVPSTGPTIKSYQCALTEAQLSSMNYRQRVLHVLKSRVFAKGLEGERSDATLKRFIARSYGYATELEFELAAVHGWCTTTLDVLGTSMKKDNFPTRMYSASDDPAAAIAQAAVESVKTAMWFPSTGISDLDHVLAQSCMEDWIRKDETVEGVADWSRPAPGLVGGGS